MLSRMGKKDEQQGWLIGVSPNEDPFYLSHLQYTVFQFSTKGFRTVDFFCSFLKALNTVQKVFK